MVYNNHMFNLFKKKVAAQELPKEESHTESCTCLVCLRRRDDESVEDFYKRIIKAVYPLMQDNREGAKKDEQKQHVSTS